MSTNSESSEHPCYRYKPIVDIEQIAINYDKSCSPYVICLRDDLPIRNAKGSKLFYRGKICTIRKQQYIDVLNEQEIHITLEEHPEYIFYKRSFISSPGSYN